MTSRHNVISIIAAFYAVPLFMITAYSSWFYPSASRLTLFAIGMLLTSVGSLLFLFMLLKLERPSEIESEPEPPPLPPPLPLPNEEESSIDETAKKDEERQMLMKESEALKQALEEAAQKEQELLEEIAYRNDELRKLMQENNLRQREEERIAEEFSRYRKMSEEIREQENMQAFEYQETISEQRATIEQKQHQIEQLDNKIRDLTYEIKTLLQLADMSSSAMHSADYQTPNKHGFAIYESATEYQVPLDHSHSDYEYESNTTTIHTEEEAKKQLKRCIDIAQKITGSHHFGSQKSRLADLALDNYALDLRRLCDSLRSETAGTTFVYSPKDNKLLFSNNQVKELLGWSPEKFVQDFDTIVQEGMVEWKNSILQLSAMNSTNTRLVMKAKSGHDHLLYCKLGLIPTGVFRNNVIGVLYQA